MRKEDEIREEVCLDSQSTLTVDSTTETSQLNGQLV